VILLVAVLVFNHHFLDHTVETPDIRSVITELHKATPRSLSDRSLVVSCFWRLEVWKPVSRFGLDETVVFGLPSRLIHFTPPRTCSKFSNTDDQKVPESRHSEVRLPLSCLALASCNLTTPVRSIAYSATVHVRSSPRLSIIFSAFSQSARLTSPLCWMRQQSSPGLGRAFGGLVKTPVNHPTVLAKSGLLWLALGHIPPTPQLLADCAQAFCCQGMADARCTCQGCPRHF
jgi:hypothetical protein